MIKNRRNFIKKICLSCGSVLVLPACSNSISYWRFFTEEEAKLTIGIAEQFIPTDKDPGATDARVINYIDKQLVGPFMRFQETYRKGLISLQSSAKELFGKEFSKLDWDEQMSFLKQMEKSELPEKYWEEVKQQSFFKLVLDHTMQGFYGSPRHGGNCNYVSYKMMKIDYPHVIGQNRYNENDLIKKKATL